MLFCLIALLILLSYFLFSIGEIINPVQLTDYSDINENIISIESDEVETTNNSKFKIIKDIKEIIYNEQSYFLSSNLFLCQDESFYYSLLAGNDFYNKTPYIKNNITIDSIPNKIMTMYFDAQIFGCFKEINFSVNGNTSENEIVTYGKTNGKIFFVYTKLRDWIRKEYDFGNIISCKLIISKHYICAFLLNNNIKIIIAENRGDNLYLNLYQINERIELFNNNSIIDNLILFDTDQEFFKILCTYKNDNNSIKCCIINVKPQQNLQTNSITFEIEIFDLKQNYEVSLFKKHRCYFTKFNSEFLLCCGGENKISCSRNYKTSFGLILNFQLIYLV